MDVDIEKLEKMAGLWNEYSDLKRKLPIKLRDNFFALIGLLVLIALAFTSLNSPQAFSVTFLTVLLIGSLTNIHLFRKEDATIRKQMMDKLDKYGKEEAKYFLQLTEEIKSASPSTNYKVLKFQYNANPYSQNRTAKAMKLFLNAGPYEEEIYEWKALILNNAVILHHDRDSHLYVENPDEFRIFRGDKAFMSNYYKAETTIHHRDYIIWIHEESWKNYLRCLENTYEEKEK